MDDSRERGDKTRDRKLWVIGVSDEDASEWEHFKLRTTTEREACRRALDEATFSNPRIYMSLRHPEETERDE